MFGRLRCNGYDPHRRRRPLLAVDRQSRQPQPQAGLARFPIYTSFGASLGATQRFNRLEVTVKSLADRTVYQPSFLVDGTTSSNDDRDLNQFGGQLRASYEVLPGLKPFVEVGADRRVHDLTFDRSGLMRDSDWPGRQGGHDFRVWRTITGELALGYLNTPLPGSDSSRPRWLAVDGSLIWNASALTTARLTASTRVDESIVAGVSGSFTREIGLQVDHAFRRWLIGTVKFGYGIDDYVGSPRLDHRYSVSLALLYKLSARCSSRASCGRTGCAPTHRATTMMRAPVMLGVRLQR